MSNGHTVFRSWCLRTANSRGAALAASLLWLGMLMVMGMGIVSFTTSGTVRVTSEENRAIALNAADAGLQHEFNVLWRQFRVVQRFDDLDNTFTGTTASAPRSVLSGSFPSSVRYTAGLVNYVWYTKYSRRLVIRSVGWVDQNGNGVLDEGEPSRGIETQIQFSLERSNVFDYAYFVNNYGWMYNYTPSSMIVNGDVRANGDFEFRGGVPTINGSVYACRNDKLIPAATGTVNMAPAHWSNSYYSAHAPQQARQVYQASRMGDKGSDEYETWRDIIYDENASVVRGDPSGAVLADVNGTRSLSGEVLSTKATHEVVMPDLADLSYYIQQSQTYVDSKDTYLDNSNNPYAGEPAYIEVYNSATNSYQRVTTNGVYYGSLALIGTTDKPVRIHGPVTVTGDIAIKGVMSGQGSLYAGRNIHIVGSITYAQGPNFSGNDPTLIDKANEKKDLLGLAARASIIMGNTKTMSSTALNYMRPPNTRARYDDDGNLIPAFDALQTDPYGVKRYQSLLGDNYINSISESVDQINAVLYTNFLGGGDIGQKGKGVTFNGSLISRDEAMITHSLPLVMNYDNRLRWRADLNDPLVNITLPVAPVFRTMTWDEI